MNVTPLESSTRTVVNVHGSCIKAGAFSTWKEIVATFTASQDIRESSRNLYTRTLSQFFIWMNQTKRNIKELKRTDILEYKDHLFEIGLSSLTIGSYLTSLKMFFNWSESEKIYPNISKNVKLPRRKQAFKKQHLTRNQVEQLLDVYKSASPRNYAIVNLMVRCGLRTIEVCRLDVSDITYRNGVRILKIWGKGKDTKDDFVVLSDKSYQPIKDYLSSRKIVRLNEPLFISESRQNAGGRLTTRTISKVCKESLLAIGLDSNEYTAHSLRHTTAVAILKGGGNITDVQDVLRHSNPSTSQIYTESIKEEMRLENAPELMLDNLF